MKYFLPICDDIRRLQHFYLDHEFSWSNLSFCRIIHHDPTIHN
jgi:hypothetical protein